MAKENWSRLVFRQEISIVEKALLLEKDVVVTNKFNDWRSNLVPMTRGDDWNVIKPLNGHDLQNAEVNKPKEIILEVIEEVIPNTSNQQIFPLQSANQKSALNFVSNIQQDSSQLRNYPPSASKIQTDLRSPVLIQPSFGTTLQPRQPRMSGSWKVPESGIPLSEKNPVKIFVTPQSSPILLRRSEPQPNTNGNNTFSEGNGTVWTRPLTAVQNTSSSVNLRDHTVLTAPRENRETPVLYQNTAQTSQLAPNQVEFKKKNLLDLPARMLNTPSRPQLAGSHTLKTQPEAYRPLLSSGFRDPSKRSSSPQGFLERGPELIISSFARESRSQANPQTGYAVSASPTAPVAMVSPQFISQTSPGHSQFQNDRPSQVSWAKQSQSTATNWDSQTATQPRSFERPAHESAEDSRLRGARSADHFRAASESSWGSNGPNARVPRSPQPSYSRNPLLAMPRF